MQCFRRKRVPAVRRTSQRRGVAAVEFAIVAPIFFMVVLVMIEFGRMLMVQQVLTSATREGARRAIVESATQTEVEALVQTYLSNTSVSGASVKVSPTDLTSVGFGDSVAVSVSVPFSSVSWTGNPWFLGGTTLEATTTMQAERLQ